MQCISTSYKSHRSKPNFRVKLELLSECTGRVIPAQWYKNGIQNQQDYCKETTYNINTGPETLPDLGGVSTTKFAAYAGEAFFMLYVFLRNLAAAASAR